MKKIVKTGCKDYYVHDLQTKSAVKNACEVLGRKPTLKECKECNCPGNIYTK